MIEQYGTGIPRIKRACDAAGVAFSYRKDVNATVIRFERPGAQFAVAEDDSATGEDRENDIAADAARSVLPGDLSKNERRAMELAATNGNLTTRALADDVQVAKRTASTTLRKLAERGLLEWVGKGPSDPNQFYRIPR